MRTLLAVLVGALCLATPARADEISPVTDGLTWVEIQVADDFWTARHVPTCSPLSAFWDAGVEIQTAPLDTALPFWGYGADCAIHLNPDHFERPKRDRRSRVDQRIALIHECVDVVQQVGAARGLSYAPGTGVVGSVMDIYSPDTPWSCRVWAKREVERRVALNAAARRNSTA